MLLAGALCLTAAPCANVLLPLDGHQPMFPKEVDLAGLLFLQCVCISVTGLPTYVRLRLDRSYAWKVVYLDLSARQGEPSPPPPPSKDFPPVDESRRMSRYRFKRIQAISVPCTSAPRNLPWRYPGDSSHTMSDVLDQPYKKAFVRRPDERGGGRGRGRGEGRGGRRGRGKSGAWRKETGGPRIRQGGKAGRGSGASSMTGDVPQNYPRRAPAVDEGKVRPSPFPSPARSDTRSSMCFGSLAIGRSQCRLVL